MANIIINRRNFPNPTLQLSRELENSAGKPYRWLTINNFACYCCQSFMSFISTDMTVKDIPQILKEHEGEFMVAPALGENNEQLFFENGTEIYQVQKAPETVEMSWT